MLDTAGGLDRSTLGSVPEELPHEGPMDKPGKGGAVPAWLNANVLASEINRQVCGRRDRTGWADDGVFLWTCYWRLNICCSCDW
jgi:hypothetical protein